MLLRSLHSSKDPLSKDTKSDFKSRHYIIISKRLRTMRSLNLARILSLFCIVAACCSLECGQGSTQTNESTLSPGWDNFNQPLSSGKVLWTILDNGTLQVNFEVNGASPNHRYLAGAHFFDPGGFGKWPEVCHFGGTKISCDRGPQTREGVTATVIGAWDFGILETNKNGYGKAQFTLSPFAGTYYVQFTVRMGDQCNPATGQTSGCAVVYRTGTKFGQGLEDIIARHHIGQSETLSAQKQQAAIAKRLPPRKDWWPPK
jgi:hypothetical protein